MGRATLFYQSPVHIVREEGVYLYDNDGHKDFCRGSGIRL